MTLACPFELPLCAVGDSVGEAIGDAIDVVVGEAITVVTPVLLVVELVAVCAEGIRSIGAANRAGGAGYGENVTMNIVGRSV